MRRNSAHWRHDSEPHLGVVHKLFQAVHEVCAIEGVAADAHDCALAQALLSGLEHCFVCEGARSGHDPNFAGRVDVPLHNAGPRLRQMKTCCTFAHMGACSWLACTSCPQMS